MFITELGRKAKKKLAHPKPQPKPVPRPFTMYDSVNLSQIPTDAEAVAGYVDGWWQTFKLFSRFPTKKRLSIAVRASGDARCLDVETGDATNAEAPGWVLRQKARKNRATKPMLYTSVSNVDALLAELGRHGIQPHDVVIWSAHYTHKEHICSAGTCGYNVNVAATQWTDKALGRNLDASLCSPGFLG